MDETRRDVPHEKLIRPSYAKARKVMRIVGPAVFLLGLTLTAVGFLTVIAGDPFDHPLRAALPFVGMPLMFVGAVLSMFAFMGAVARYAASEHAPVAVDTVNYVGEGTRPGVSAMAHAVGSGLGVGLREAAAHEDGDTSAEDGVPGVKDLSARCPACDTRNDADAKFCDTCGGPLATGTECAKCGAENDADARFCDACGAGLGV